MKLIQIQSIKKAYELNPGAYDNEQAALADLMLQLGTKILSSKNYYSGSVRLTWTVAPKKTDLKDVIIEKDLGVIDDINDDTILKIIKTKNPETAKDLTIKDITISAMNNISALIKANTDSANFTGEVNVHFSVKQAQIHLNQVIKNTKLGELMNTNSDTIFAAIEKANTSTLQGLKIKDIDIAVNGLAAKISAKANNDKFTGDVDVSFTVKPTKTHLNQVIKTIQLGHLKDLNQTIILDAIKAPNYPAAKDLTIEDIDIDINKNEAGAVPGANIIAKETSAKFTGSVAVFFTVEKIDLHRVIPNNDLGNISSHTISNVLNAIKEKNTITAQYLTIADINGNTLGTTDATLNANKNSLYFKGRAYIKYTIGDQTKPPTGPLVPWPTDGSDFIRVSIDNRDFISISLYPPAQILGLGSVRSWFERPENVRLGYVIPTTADAVGSDGHLRVRTIKVAPTQWGAGGLLQVKGTGPYQ